MAELKGKLSEESFSVERSEDVLTSNVFQCLRYLKPNDGIVPFLNAVFRSNGYKIAEDKLDRELEWEVDYYFWPVGVERKREPDVLLYLKSRETKYAIVVEAKYHFGPSDKEEIDKKSGNEFGNQLSDQFIDLIKLRYRLYDKTINLECFKENCYLLYLTKNFAKPMLEINSAIEQYQQNSSESEINIKEHLLWTNWTKVWSVLKKIPIHDFPYDLIKNDLLSLLERKGFKEFSGFKIDDWEGKYKSFYREIWFQMQHKFHDKEKAGFYYELLFQNLKDRFICSNSLDLKYFKEDV
ncbi:hypothetical protein ACFLT2_10410 [Acidobacteriota bacterium]